MPPVTTAGIYQMPLSDYVNDPAPEASLNAGTAHRLLTQSAKHAWVNHPRLGNLPCDESSRLDLGTICHAMLLEDDSSKVVQIEADDWRTKAAKEARDDARAAGKLPILKKDFATVKLMVSVAIDAIYGSELCEAWMDSEPEQTLVWQEGDVWCRSRPDKLQKNGQLYFDYKTCVGTAHPALFGKGPLIRHGYDLQIALGMRGVNALLKPKSVTGIFVCQEMDPPYAVSFVSLSPAFLAIANERLEAALYQWNNCLKSNHWPAYPAQVAYVEPPGWYGMEQLPEAV